MKLFLMGLFWLLSNATLLAFGEDVNWFGKVTLWGTAVFGYFCMLWATLREFKTTKL